jgi:hypothetical protein
VKGKAMFSSSKVNWFTEIASLKEAKDELFDQLNQQRVAKQAILNELADKCKNYDTLELERNVYSKQISEQLQKVRAPPRLSFSNNNITVLLS